MVAFEGIHIDLILVNQDDGPVVDEAVFALLDLGNVKHGSKRTRGDGGEVFRDEGVVVVSLLNLVLGTGDEANQLITLRRNTRKLALDLRWDFLQGFLPSRDGLGLVTDKLHDFGDSFIAGCATEQNKVLAGLAVEFLRIRQVPGDREGMGNMGASQKTQTIVGLVGIETDEQAASSLVEGVILGRNGDAKSGGEGFLKARKALRVVGRVEAHELALTAVDGLDKGDLDLGEASFLQRQKK